MNVKIYLIGESLLSDRFTSFELVNNNQSFKIEYLLHRKSENISEYCSQRKYIFIEINHSTFDINGVRK